MINKIKWKMKSNDPNSNDDWDVSFEMIELVSIRFFDSMWRLKNRTSMKKLSLGQMEWSRKYCQIGWQNVTDTISKGATQRTRQFYL